MIHDATKFAMGIDFSSTALHCAYGPPGSPPYRLKLPLTTVVDEDRIIETYEQTGKLLDVVERNWPHLETSILVVERPFLGHSVKTLKTLTHIQTSIVLTAHLRQWYPIQEDPNKIRKKVLGKGTSSKKGEIKQLAMEYVLNKYGWDVGPDEADSVVIWDYAEWLTLGSDVSPEPSSVGH